MSKIFPNSALVILDNKILLPHTLNYLQKFNFKNLTLIKKKSLKLNYNLLRKYNFNFKIKNYSTQEFSYNLLKRNFFLDFTGETFLIIKTSKFINLNLFTLHNIFINNIKKLIITIPKKINKLTNSEIFFVKKNFFFSYDFSFQKILKNSSYKINYTDCEYIDVKKMYNKKKIDKFFSKIYSKAIILDRDGVININKGYVGFKKDFKFQEGAVDAIKYLNKNNFNLFVVSNQSGIARGYFSDEDVKKLHEYLKDLLTKNQCYINKIYYSPYHKDGIIKKYKKNSSCRKPGIKLFKVLCKEWIITNKKNIIMIGDQNSDIEFAKRAKIKSALFKGGNLLKFIKNLRATKKF